MAVQVRVTWYPLVIVVRGLAVIVTVGWGTVRMKKLRVEIIHLEFVNTNISDYTNSTITYVVLKDV